MKAIIASLLLLFIGTTQSLADPASLAPEVVAAQGGHASILSIPAAGRYSITVDSAQGTALQLVDRMRGPGEIIGEAGVSNGRIDAFLDAGTYKIVTRVAEHGSGNAQLKLHAFEEQQPKPIALIGTAQVSTTLKDFEQRSYWIRVERDAVVPFEAVGRSVADLRVWRDGVWLTDTVPESEITEPAPGQPLRALRFAPRLAAGVYRVTVYGGPALPWTEAAPQSPLYVRGAIPQTAVAARQRFTMNQTGIARVRVPKDATYFRLELVQPGAASMRVEDDDTNSPFGRGSGAIVTINPKSTVPMAEISRAKSATGYHLVTIVAPAGTQFVLQHFEASVVYGFDASGDYYVSTIHAGPASDAVDATAVLTRREYYGNNERQPETFLDARVIEFDAARGWRRRFNVLDDVRLMFRLTAPTRLRITGAEIAAQYRVQPFVTFRPSNFRLQPWRESGTVFDLNAGLFELEIHPQERGILTLALQADGAAPPESSAVIPSAHFGRVHFESSRGYALYTNREPGIANGVILRSWPVDLSVPLPIAQGAQQSLEIAVSVAARGRLAVRDDAGVSVPLRVDARDAVLAPIVERGEHTIRLDAPGRAPRDLVVEFIPDVVPPDTSWVDSAVRAATPTLTLRPQTPLYMDLPRLGQTAVTLHVETPALYRVETSGLLDTVGQMSTRTQPSLMRDDTSGTGRNFLLQEFLREGDYQVNVQLAGDSAGHFGLHAERTALVDAGVLPLNEVARATLPAGRGLRYRFHIDHRATYQLQTLGLNRVMRIRVDDRAAWPLVTPGIPGDLTLDFAPGDYEVIVLPEPISARVVTALREVKTFSEKSGHGPHALELNQVVQHEWHEPDGDGARLPDEWTLSLPARAQVRARIDQHMQATLTRSDAATQEPLAAWDSQHPLERMLDAGTYRIAVQSLRKNNRVHYTLAVETETLVDGATREIVAPATLPVSVGRDAWVDLYSLGRHDVRAKLFDAHDVLVAENDDASDDWNFRIAQTLPMGAYRLRVEPAAAESTPTTVTLRVAPEHALREATWGSDNTLRGRGVHTFELPAPTTADALYFSVDSSRVTGLQIEIQSASGWQTLTTQLYPHPWVVIPYQSSDTHRYRVRIWNTEAGEESLHWRAEGLTLPVQSEQSLAQGNVRWTAAAGVISLARVHIGTQGVMQFSVGSAGLSWGDEPNQPLRALTHRNVNVAGTQIWLARTHDPESNTTLKARAFALSPTDAHSVIDVDIPERRDASVQLAGVTGDAVVIATSRDGQPGIATLKSLAPTHMGVTPNAAVTLVGARDSSLQFWNTSDASQALAAQFRIIALRRAERAPLTMGAVDAEINSRELVSHVLNAANATSRWTLEPGTGVALRRAHETVAVLWAGTTRYDEQVDVAADEAWVFNTTDTVARYSVELSSSDPSIDRSADTKEVSLIVSHTFPSAGSWRVAIAAGAQRVHIRGAERITAVDTTGRVQYASDVTLTGPAVVQVAHGVGAVLMWSDVARAVRDARVMTTVAIPNRVNLSGTQQQYRIERAQPTLVRVRGSAPMVLQWSNAAGAATVDDAFPRGASTALFAPSGISILEVRALGAQALGGALEFDETPTIALHEGVGPSRVLGPGDARLFTFTVAREGAMGIGIRASSDDIDAVVYDSRGKSYGHGVVLMPTLTPGSYYLSVRIPEAGKPVTFQPVIVGSTARSTLPSADILRRFVESKPDTPLITVPEVQGSAGAGTALRQRNPAPENLESTPDGDAAPEENNVHDSEEE